MLALSDQEDELDNNETESSSVAGTCTTISRATSLQHPTAPTVSHNININYRHCYTVEKKDGEEIDIPALLQSLAHHTTVQSPSKDLQSSQAAPSRSLSSVKPKSKTLFLTDFKKTITFTALNISDPPHLKYSDDLDQLPVDWESSSYLRIKGVPIPLKYWAEVYRWAKLKQWSILKDTWTNWKVRSLILWQRYRNYRISYLFPFISSQF